ncbi:MAG: class I SAM-dependent methyltransferase [Phycisphaerales bacterium JB059]
MTLAPCWPAADFAYTDRPSKAAYIARVYAPALRGSVLDVGCGDRLLAEHLPGIAYTGVDLGPRADVRLDLDREDLPFGTGQFQTVVATDVLEHLDRLHEVFDACCRIAARYLLVSLPNPAGEFLLSVAQGSADRLKYYGLPLDAPEDRHRWFFTSQQAAQFLRERGARNGFGVERLDVAPGARLTWTGGEGRNRLADPAFSASTTWCLLARRHPIAPQDPTPDHAALADDR